MELDKNALTKIDLAFDGRSDPASVLKELKFAARDLTTFATDVEAYHQLVFDLLVQQYASTQLVIRGTSVKRIFVDGGFSKNSVYMHLLASFFPAMDVYASAIPQATAIGAALAIHDAWNGLEFPSEIIQLKSYSAQVALPMV